MILKNKMQTKSSNGVLSKGWYTDNSKEYLVKGNSVGLTKGMCGYEPFSEVMASNLANVLQIPHVQYMLLPANLFPEIRVYDCNYVSVCERIDTAGQLLHFARYADVMCGGECHDYFTFLLKRKQLRDAVYRLLAFDAITGNSDRHLNNFDLIWDGTAATIAPILDNGASFLALIPDDSLRANWKLTGPDKAKPFKDTHTEQVHLFEKRLGTITLSNKSVEEIFSEWLQSSTEVLQLLSEQRQVSIKDYLYKRLNHYSYMFGGANLHEIDVF